MKILIHHHALVLEDKDNEYRIQSFIGCWIDKIAQYVELVGIAMHIANENETEKQDYTIKSKNIKFHSLGPQINKSRTKRNEFVKAQIQLVSTYYDITIIRGITPRQLLISKSCKSRLLYFLFVGSIRDSFPKFKFKLNYLKELLFYYFRLNELKTISKNAIFLANSISGAYEIQEYTKTKCDVITTNTISKEDFNLVDELPNEKKHYILFVGRVVKEKGIEELIKAFIKIKNLHNELKLIVVGPIQNEYKQKLFKIDGYTKVSKDIIFKGFIHFGVDLFKIYRQASVYVLPSYHEGFPHSVWEAGMCKTPIIVSNLRGITTELSSNDVWFVRSMKVEDIFKQLTILLSENYSFEKDKKIENMWNKSYEHRIEIGVEKLIKHLESKLNEIN